MEKFINAKTGSAMECGRQAFLWFRSGAQPFTGKATPQNPNKPDTKEFTDWKIGYESERTKWFLD